jgi:hypothetical protein
VAPSLLCPNDLSDRVERTCRLFSSYLDLLTGDDASDRSAKAACEVALLAAYLKGEPALSARFGDWAEATLRKLEPRLRGSDVLARLLWLPSRATMYGVGHGFLKRAGLLCPPLDAVIDLLARHPLVDSREMSPYEALEAAWAAELSTGAAHPRPLSRLATERPVHPLLMTEDDAYAYTHTVFYLTDLGRHPGAAGDTAEIADVCDAGASWSLARADFDLFAEFALCALFAGAGPTPALHLGLYAWAIAWDDLGCVPDRALDRLGDDRDRKSVFFAIYHANLVAGLLAATLWTRPEWLATPDCAPVPASRLTGMLRQKAFPASPFPLPDAALGDPVTLLVEVFGPRVGRAIGASVPGSTLALGHPDLAIHRGMHLRELSRVVAGTAGGLRVVVPSSSTLVAGEWLALFRAAIHLLELPGAETLEPELDAIIAHMREKRGPVPAGRQPGC